MTKYEKINLNPKGKRTSDCTTRAIAACLGIAWQEALKLQCEAALKTGYAPNDPKNVQKIMEAHGFVRRKQPRKPSGRKYRLLELDDAIGDLSGPILVNVANHATAVIDGTVNDIWDCRGKTVLNYYVENFR